MANGTKNAATAKKATSRKAKPVDSRLKDVADKLSNIGVQAIRQESQEKFERIMTARKAVESCIGD